jgi:hypothetical protein
VKLFRRIRDWAVGPGGWLADSNLDAQLSAVDIELDAETLDDDVAWINEAATQDPNDGPGRIRIIHQGNLGYRYWYTNTEGLITSKSGFRTEGKAWRAALTEQNNETAIDDDYPN